jgi:putative heme iron utilization protein
VRHIGGERHLTKRDLFVGPFDGELAVGKVNVGVAGLPPRGAPLARRRLTFACTAEPIARESTAHAELVLAFRQKFGATIDVVSTLPDFQFVRLQPQSGRVVAGFGAAFEVNPRDWSDLTPVARGPGRPT